MRGAVIFGCLVSINARRGRNQYPQTENARVRRGIGREDQDSNDAVKRHVGSHAAALLPRVRLIQERGSVLYMRVASESEGDWAALSSFAHEPASPSLLFLDSPRRSRWH